MFNLALYGITLSSKTYVVLAALLAVAGLYIIINPRAFLRWGRGRDAGREPGKSALLAARFVGAAMLAMCVVGYLSLNQQ